LLKLFKKFILFEKILHRSIQYLRHLVKAKTKYNIHSPFVYAFYTEAIRGKDAKKSFPKIENYRNFLLHNKTFIEVHDFGTGKNKKRKRKLCKTAASSISSQKQASILYSIAKYLKAESILELGTNFGISTAYLAESSPKAEILSIEGCPNIAKYALAFFEVQKYNTINLINHDFDSYFNLNNTLNFDLIYIDGNHTKDASIRYFNKSLQNQKEHFAIIIDDIHWSKEMTAAWKEIILCEKIQLSIDFYHFGIVFIGKKMQKQDWKLKL
jgi:predicted O-methyltransferase YrrM